MERVTISLLIITGMTCQIGLFYAWLYARQLQQRQNLAVALTCLALSLYDIVSLGLHRTNSSARVLLWQPAYGVALALTYLTLSWFVFRYLSIHLGSAAPATRWLKIFSTYAGLMVLLRLVIREGILASDLFLGQQHLMGLSMAGYLLVFSGRAYYRDKENKTLLHLSGALGIFFLGALNDFAVSCHLYKGNYTLGYAAMGFVLLCIHDLINTVAEVAETKKALAQEQHLLNALIENIPDHIYFKDRESHFIRINPAQARWFGLDSPKDAVGKTDFDFFSMEHAQQAYLDEQEIIQTGEPIVGIVEKETWPDSQETWVSTTKVPLYGQHMDIIGVFGISRDITERVKAEGEILRLQRLLQSITDSMPSALITLSPKGEVLTWNPAAEAMTGRPAAQVQGQCLWDVCPRLLSYRALFERARNERQAINQRRKPLTTQHGTIYHNVDIFPLVAEDLEGIVLRIDDATRQVQIEEMMLQSAKMASVGGVAAGIAHEINNPLMSIMQSAQMLQLNLDVNRAQTRTRLQKHAVNPENLGHYLDSRHTHFYLEGIRETGARAAKIVNDLLSFSRKRTSKSAPHNLNTLIEQTLALAVNDYDLKKQYDFRNIEIVRELAPDLPDVICDGQQIQQVILNLMRNAAQAMAAKKIQHASNYHPRLTLRTTYRPEPEGAGWVRFEVEDNGPGMPKAVKSRLFEPFLTTKDIGEGTGLGLWLCWSIVAERHKGRIWIDSRIDVGTRIMVELATTIEQTLD